MIKEINFSNYKAFQNGSIKIKPITLLLGANSIGKSSILQLISLLHQTALKGEKYQSALRLNGGFVNIGESINLFYKKDSKKILKFELKFEKNELLELFKKGMINDLLSEIDIIRYQQMFGLDEFHNYNFVKSLLKDKTHAINERQELEFHFKSINTTIRSEKKNNNFLLKKVSGSITSDNEKKRIIFSDLEINKYLETFDVLKKLSSNTTNNKFAIEFELVTKNDILYLKNIIIKNSEKDLVKLEFDNNFNFSSFVICNEKIILDESTLTELKSAIKNNVSVFSTIEYLEKRKKNEFIAFTITNIYNYTIKILKDSFGPTSINYVSPLRAYPQRYYLLDKRNYDPFLDTLDGNAIAEKLKDNPRLIDFVNTWLKKFNVSIEIKKIIDVIHSFNVEQGLLKMELTDVGFGISQVLPVIVQGFISSEDSITLIEQPEVHLHPKMQAELGDLFIDIVNDSLINKSEKYFIIETHSEYLLKRIRRRIFEKKIDRNDVAIYVFEADEKEVNTSIIKEIEIEENGNFVYPKDFYGEELLNDTFIN